MVKETSPMRISRSSAHPSVRDMLLFAPSICSTRWVLICVPTSFAKSLRMTTIWDPWSSMPALVLWLLTRMSISRRGRENLALRLVASPRTETRSISSPSACSKDAVSTRRGLRRSTISLRTGGQAAKMCASVILSSLPSKMQPTSSLVRVSSSTIAWYRYCGGQPVEEGVGRAVGAGGEGLQQLRLVLSRVLSPFSLLQRPHTYSIIQLHRVHIVITACV